MDNNHLYYFVPFKFEHYVVVASNTQGIILILLHFSKNDLKHCTSCKNAKDSLTTSKKSFWHYNTLYQIQK